MLTWKIRYFDRRGNTFHDRYLCLLTETLDPVTRAAIELVTEAKTDEDRRQRLRFRSLFTVPTLEELSKFRQGIGGFRGVVPSEYFEDESGAEITLRDMGPILTGNPNAILLPSGSKQHDIDLLLAEPKQIPVLSVTLIPDGLRVLGYFARDLAELSKSAFMKDQPGTLSRTGFTSPAGGFTPAPSSPDFTLQTAATDAEIRPRAATRPAQSNDSVEANA